MAEHEVLFAHPVEDVQSAWALLLHCAGFAEGHNAGLWTCLCNILFVVVDGDRQDVTTMLLSLGGLGLRDAVLTSPPAFWALPWFGQGILMWLHSSFETPQV